MAPTPSTPLTWKWSDRWPGCIEPIGFPENVRACVTTQRVLGNNCSGNFSLYVHEPAEQVHQQRRALAQQLGYPIYWLSRQLHGTRVANLSTPSEEKTVQLHPDEFRITEPGDAQWTNHPQRIIGVLTADCLPVLFANQKGTVVAAAHAGWKGLHAGVLETTIHSLTTNTSELIAWIGPGIGPNAFQVGHDVRDAFCQHNPISEAAFTPDPDNTHKWFGNLPLLAEQRLKIAGIPTILQSGLCTYQDSDLWFSYRCTPYAGRFASLIWIQ